MTDWVAIPYAAWKARYGYQLHNRLVNDLNYLKAHVDALEGGGEGGGVSNALSALGIVFPYKGGGVDATPANNSTFASSFERFNNLTIDTGVTVNIAASPQIIVCNKIQLKGTIFADGKGAGAGAERCGGKGALTDNPDGYALDPWVAGNYPQGFRRTLAFGGSSGFNGASAYPQLNPFAAVKLLEHGILGGGGGAGGGNTPGAGDPVNAGENGAAGHDLTATGRSGSSGGSGVGGGGGGGDGVPYRHSGGARRGP